MLRLSWLISSGIAIFGVMLIQYFYQFKSETGNLGVVGLAIVFPFVALCIFITFRYFRVVSAQYEDSLMLMIYNIAGIFFIAILIYFTIDYKNEVFAQLGGSTTNPNSSIYGEFWLNAETSKIYFNFYTILIVISATAIIGSLSTFIIKKIETHISE